jgi:hypothetical protein
MHSTYTKGVIKCDFATIYVKNSSALKERERERDGGVGSMCERDKS